MNRVLAYKKHSAGIMYMVLTVIWLGLIAAGITRGQIPLGVIGVPMTVLCAILSYRYLSLPSHIIELSDENTLILPGGVVVPLCDVSDVSFRRATAMRMQYRWGTVTLLSKFGSYKFSFVDDCEEVSNTLNDLIAEERDKAKAKK